MFRSFQQFFRLSSEQKRFVFRAVFIIPMTYAGLELLGYQRLFSLIRHFCGVDREAHRTANLKVYPKLLNAVARRYPLKMKCLGRSVALCWLLRLESIDATVHIGVRKDEHDLDAHAWVQCGDSIINDAEDVADRYTRIAPSYPEADAIPGTRLRNSTGAQP